MNKKAVSASLLSMFLATPVLASEWDIDPSHSAAQFSVRHMMISTVRGQFDTLKGTVSVDDKDITKSKVDVTIDAASINTRDEKRDTHLKSADFFDVAKYPQLTFRSTKVKKTGANTLEVIGDLTMHGQTKPVTLSVETTAPQKSPWGQTVRGLTATAKLNRKDWGLGWNKTLETGGVLVGEEVSLQIDAELIEKAPAKHATAQ